MLVFGTIVVINLNSSPAVYILTSEDQKNTQNSDNIIVRTATCSRGQLTHFFLAFVQ